MILADFLLPGSGSATLVLTSKECVGRCKHFEPSSPVYKQNRRTVVYPAKSWLGLYRILIWPAIRPTILPDTRYTAKYWIWNCFPKMNIYLQFSTKPTHISGSYFTLIICLTVFLFFRPNIRLSGQSDIRSDTGYKKGRISGHQNKINIYKPNIL